MFLRARRNGLRARTRVRQKFSREFKIRSIAIMSLTSHAFYFAPTHRRRDAVTQTRYEQYSYFGILLYCIIPTVILYYHIKRTDIMYVIKL